MKEKRNLLIGMILSGLIGWALGFLRLPRIEQNFSFLLGLLTGLALVLWVLLLLVVWRKNAMLSSLLVKQSVGEAPGKASRTHALTWILVAVFIVGGGLLSSFLIYRQQAFYQAQTESMSTRIAQQAELLETARKSNLVILMNTVFDNLEEELKKDPERRLSEETIARIAALNYTFKPYSYLQGDSLSEKKWSPERGQLLLVLSGMNIDSASFDRIRFKASFAGADLRGADLRGAYLKGIDLQGADLQDADLREANLQGADLRGANLWGANLGKARIEEADLKRAELSWANLNEANLHKADLDGASLSSVQLRKADLRESSIRWADLSGAFLNGSDLSGASMRETNLSRANLQDANLSDANIMRLNLEEANLSGVALAKAAVEKENWLELLSEWRVMGAQEIQEGYKLVDDASGRTKYQLEKSGD